MSHGTIYTDPFLGTEILFIEGQGLGSAGLTCGIVYNPQKTTTPVPWSSICPHCLAGRQQEISPPERREIKLLLSRDVNETCDLYQIPTNGRPLSLVYWTQGKTKLARISRSRQILHVTKRSGAPRLEYEGDRHSFQSPVLHRCLKFLFSKRPATREEIAAIIRPLVDRQVQRMKEPRPRGGQLLPCKRIDWIAIATKLTS